MTARTRFAHVQPSISTVESVSGFSYALCPDVIVMGVPQSNSVDYRWTLAHEWGHIVACASSYIPVGFPSTPAPVPWRWAGLAVWQWEEWADCVAESLTGYDGSVSRSYPSCTDEQPRRAVR